MLVSSGKDSINILLSMISETQYSPIGSNSTDVGPKYMGDVDPACVWNNSNSPSFIAWLNLVGNMHMSYKCLHQIWVIIIPIVRTNCQSCLSALNKHFTSHFKLLGEMYRRQSRITLFRLTNYATSTSKSNYTAPTHVHSRKYSKHHVHRKWPEFT